MDDSALYTGVDNDPIGTFGNEAVESEVDEKIQDQERQIKELTPKLKGIIDMLEREKKTTLDFIAGYIDNNKDSDDLFRAELKAAGRYNKYLDELKTKFTLELNETKK